MRGGSLWPRLYGEAVSRLRFVPPARCAAHDLPREVTQWMAARSAQLFAGSLRHPEDDRRHDQDRDAEGDDLSFVGDPELQEDPVRGAREEDDQGEGEDRRAHRGPHWVVAGAVEQVVETVVAGDPPLGGGPGIEEGEEQQRKEDAAEERIGDERRIEGPDL